MRLLLTTVFIFAGLAAAQSTGQPGVTFSEVYSFKGGTDGANPESTVYVDSSGTIYGTTLYGGEGNDNLGCDSLGCGTVFKIDPSGTETVLHAFSGGADGGKPYSNVLPDMNGNLYGTASVGGNLGSSCIADSGCGVVFKIDSNGTETAFYTFSGPDGSGPSANLTRGGANDFYGTTVSGGAFNGGVVFEIDQNGGEHSVYAFGGVPGDGTNPGPIVLQQQDQENLLGTTAFGGVRDGGTVYKVSVSGTETVLHRFQGGVDGTEPSAGVTGGPFGTLYGSTGSGGTDATGVVYRLDKEGNETIVYSFATRADGFSPTGTLLRDKAGNLYGVASEGGGRDGGTIFRVDPNGNQTTLHNFSIETLALGGLFARKSNTGVFELYGTSYFGGMYGYGYVYKLTLSSGADFDVTN